jgi:hypothetical protein
MIGLLRFVFAILIWPFTSQARLHAEIAMLRQQVIVLQRKSSGRVRLSKADRWFFVQLYRMFPSILQALHIIRPETLCLRAMGIRDKPIAPRSPWQNGFAERLIVSIRRECLDHTIVFGEVHLRRLLISYASYYNQIRTHRALQKDAPIHRPIERIGIPKSRPILGGLHHPYVRI